ncbi:nuclear receptor-binding factor 2-like [Dendronephthya gigantea]|uniref:nuclear receptor-binding factor 2-like n=1 Tax=Dendronephthya gigantea TaxID=151771 RepID=UPI001069C1DB|nr:nuclear receptor-binding factor 2-like [Dendronephthya gigantea]
MDSPLNRAHQQERKAEKLISNKKYMEAIACYEIASAYIMEAMEATTASQALISMQLQYEDHLRKKKLLQVKIERIARAKMKSENCEESKATIEKNDKQHDSDVLHQESIDSSYDLPHQSNQGLQIQTDSTESEKTVRQSSIEDLQMQVLTLTQALEDSNRENNHLRNIVIRFKDILHEKFGLTQDEIEGLLIEDETEPIATSQCSNIDIQKDSPD